MRLIVTSFAIVIFLTSGNSQAGMILNGNFSTAGVSPEPYADWTTDNSSFDRPTDGGGYASFADAGFYGSSQLAQTFTLLPSALNLSFEFRLSTVTDSSTGMIPDSFQATLFDGLLNTFFPSDPMNPSLFPAFYSIDNDGMTESYDSNFVTSLDLGGGYRRVTLDVSSLSPQSLTLDFLLNGLPDGLSTTVDLDNVTYELSDATAVPEPASIILWGSFAGLMCCRRVSRRLMRQSA